MKAGIAGGGIMGQLMALSLKQAGWDVTLFDKDHKNSCSSVAAGLLSPITELEKNELCIFELGQEAIHHEWPRILSKLNHGIFFKNQGAIILSQPEDERYLTKYIQHIENKLKNITICQKLNSAMLTSIEPELTKFNQAYYVRDEAQIDAQTLLSVLHDYLLENKISWVHQDISRIYPHTIITAKRHYRFDCVFDCRGLAAKEFFKDIRSVRGELIWLHARDVVITRPIHFIHPRYHLYIVPRNNQQYIIGASEIESEDYSPISVRTTLELLTSAFFLHANFAEATMIKTATHCRPTLLNHSPKIKYSKGFIAINGLYRHGYLIAPALAAEVMRWLTNGQKMRYHSIWENIHDHDSIQS